MSVWRYAVGMKSLLFCFLSGILMSAPLPDSSAAFTENSKLKDYASLHALVKNKAKSIVWVITGDSITHGCRHTLQGRSYPEHWMERVKWELGRTSDIVINTGISGDTCSRLLGTFDFRVGTFKPQVVSINFGINDATKAPAGPDVFRTKLIELVKKVRSIGAIPIIQVPSLTLETDAKRIELRKKMSKVVREVAQKGKVLLVDHETLWNERVGAISDRKAWMNDAIHPNEAGHRYMFIKMAKDLGFYDQKSPVCAEPQMK